MCVALDRIVTNTGRAPKYTVTDQGTQFRDAFRAWCDKHGVKPRFGAVGKHGSIAVTERFILSMKTEALRRILVPLRITDMRVETARYMVWYNEYRPHSSLHGATPAEVLRGDRTGESHAASRTSGAISGARHDGCSADWRAGQARLRAPARCVATRRRRPPADRHDPQGGLTRAEANHAWRATPPRWRRSSSAASRPWPTVCWTSDRRLRSAGRRAGS